jgi:GNAT superfamily N-acetyltransferase
MIMKIEFKNELPDIEQYFELYLTTGWNEEYNLTKHELAASISNSYFSVSAYDENKLVGFGRFVSDGIMHAMIYEMIVDPDYQRKKIGSEIMNRLLKECLELNIRDIQLFCAKGKRNFYESHGFVSRPDDGPGMEYKGAR